MNIFNILDKINNDYILNQETKDENKYLKKIVEILNKERFVIITWIRNVWKTRIISDLIKKTKIQDKFFYFNKDLDTENIVNNDEVFLDYFNTNKSKKTKIIILQNISKIKWIKNFLNILFKADYKIIIVWNDVKIPNVKEIEIKNFIWENIVDNLKYGNLWFLYKLNDTKFIENYILLLKNDIFSEKIFDLKNI